MGLQAFQLLPHSTCPEHPLGCLEPWCFWVCGVHLMWLVMISMRHPQRLGPWCMLAPQAAGAGTPALGRAVCLCCACRYILLCLKSKPQLQYVQSSVLAGAKHVV